MPAFRVCSAPCTASHEEYCYVHHNRREFVKMCLAGSCRAPLPAISSQAAQPSLISKRKAARSATACGSFAARPTAISVHAAPVCDDAGGRAFFLGVPNIIMVQSSTTEANMGAWSRRLRSTWSPAPAEAGRVVGGRLGRLFRSAGDRGGPRSGQDSAELRRRDAGRLLYGRKRDSGPSGAWTSWPVRRGFCDQQGLQDLRDLLLRLSGRFAACPTTST